MFLRTSLGLWLNIFIKGQQFIFLPAQQNYVIDSLNDLMIRLWLGPIACKTNMNPYLKELFLGSR